MPLFVLLLALTVIFGPQLWARRVLRRYGRVRSDLPGSGAELARHLLKAAGMADYSVACAEGTMGDHFNPESRQVVLSPAHHDRRSLAAAVVAAHEVGHAIQHHIGFRPLFIRQRLVRVSFIAEKIASLLLVAMPLLTVATRAPGVGAACLLAGLSILLFPIVVHTVTLPVEFDASFKRALPILSSGYLDQSDLRSARTILMACALTYVAAALSGLLNFARWFQILRR